MARVGRKEAPMNLQDFAEKVFRDPEYWRSVITRLDRGDRHLEKLAPYIRQAMKDGYASPSSLARQVEAALLNALARRAVASKQKGK
jgi:hypothetical protein